MSLLAPGKLMIAVRHTPVEGFHPGRVSAATARRGPLRWSRNRPD